jgi:hypothetical protein
MAQGGSLTINPATGMPEAFNLGGLFSSLLPTLVGGAASMIPGMQFASYPMLTGILAGAATGALTNKENPLMGGLMGGLGGYSGAGIMGAGKAAAGAMGSAEAAKSAAVGGGSSGLATGGGYIPGATLGQDLAYNNALMASQASGATNSAISGASGALDIEKAMAAGKPIGMANSFANTASIAPDPTFLGNMGQAFKGMGGAATGNQAAIDAYTKGIGAESGMGALGKTALPFGAAVLSGLEPSDLYGDPLKPKEDKYDPYATLNLGNDTGLRLYASGGNVKSYAVGGNVANQSVGAGLSALYNTADGSNTPNISQDGYGLGRLSNLASAQEMQQAKTLGYAMGGPVSFADGGDTESVALEQISMAPDSGSSTPSGIATLANSAQMDPQGGQAPSDINLTAPPIATDGSLITQIANNLKADPNYQPKNPIEAAIVNQLKGSDPMQQGQSSQQGLGSIAPSQPMTPMAPTYNPSVAMGPTYYAGMNAPQGYADGGEVSNYGQNQAALNLDRLPSLNLSNGSSGQSEGFQRVLTGFGELSERGPSPGHRRVGDAMYRLFSYDPVLIDMIRGGKAPQGYADGDGVVAGEMGRMGSVGIGIQGGINPRPWYEQQAQYAQGGYLNGQGDGMSDSIPATIEGKQPARLADGEFVVPADVVSHLGNGSSKAGSKKLYAMLDKVRHARTGNKKQGKQINPAKYMPA